jgi:hypothetical protein
MRAASVTSGAPLETIGACGGGDLTRRRGSSDVEGRRSSERSRTKEKGKGGADGRRGEGRGRAAQMQLTV